MTEHDDMHLLAGAYALDALTETERHEFEAYLARSEEARTEVAELIDTAVMLGLAATPVAPPVDLKARLMAQLDSTAQLPALTESSPERSVPATPDVEGVPATATGVTATTPTAPTRAQQRDIRSLARETPPTRAESKAAARWYRKPANAILAAAAAVLLVAGGAVVGQSIAPADAQLAQASQLAELTAAADLEQSIADVDGGGSAKVLWSDDLQRSAVVIESLPELDAERVYQLWYIDAEGSAESAGTLSADSAGGPSWRVLDGDKSSSTTVGMTVEPRGGSEAPTTDPILVVSDV